jgi:hypothetical protein
VGNIRRCSVLVKERVQDGHFGSENSQGNEIQSPEVLENVVQAIGVLP